LTMNMESVTFDVPLDDLQTVDQIALNLEADRETVLRNALDMYLANYADLQEAIAEGERDIREGRTYSHEEVVARFTSQFAKDAA
jgi:predicted transcriptional regulator